MKKTALIVWCAAVGLLFLNACGRKSTPEPQQPVFNLKEFIGIYEAQLINQTATSSLVISRGVEGFDGNQVWIGGKWDGTNGNRIRAAVTKEQRNGDVEVEIPQQILQDSLSVEGKGTFYYFNDDFYLDIDYTITNGTNAKHYGLVAIKKVYNQNVTINVNVDCECDCKCDGNDCDCTCACDD